jgi:hypothetical protein
MADGLRRSYLISWPSPRSRKVAKEAHMTVHIIPNERGNPAGKLADVELHFTDGAAEAWGPLTGLKLIGFAVWERRGGGRTVTFPARQFSINGERRSFALLRPLENGAAQDGVRELILSAYATHEAREVAKR